MTSLQTLLFCSLSSIYSDWLGTGIYDVNQDGIVNLKDWSELQRYDITPLKGKPTPEQVESIVLDLWTREKLLRALCHAEDITVETFDHSLGMVKIRLIWNTGWFYLEWKYTLFSYEFEYWYGITRVRSKNEPRGD